MRKIRWLVFPILLLLLLGCGLLSGIQDIQKAASTVIPIISTQMPAIMTSAPTALGAIETAAASAMPPSNCPTTPSAGGLGISAENAKTVLQLMQQFTFADGTVDGQPALIATLSPGGESAYPDIAQGFSAQFIGDVCNLSRIKVIIPRTDTQASVDQGTQVVNLALTGTLPVDVQFSFMLWLTQNYASVEVGGQQQTTIKNMQFTLARTQNGMSLEILPVK
jgi:hypothetical protein